MKTPDYMMKTFWEKKDGYRYEQPVHRLNGKIRDEYPQDSYEYKNWGKIYWDSKAYNDSLDYCNFDSYMWQNKLAKLRAFEKIYNFVKSGASGQGSAVTQLLPFEIFLMNDGFEMINFCELNAINPGVSIVGEQVNEFKYKNITGLYYGRSYIKDDNFIYIAFGLKTEDRLINFYFKTSKSKHYFQVENSIEKYHDSISGKLKPVI